MSIKKSIFNKTELRNLVAKENSRIVVKNAVIDAYLLPCYMNDVKSGLWNALYRKLKKYDNKLEGILLGYDNLKVDLDEGRFYGRYAEVKYPVSCVCYIFQPIIGAKLEGTVNQLSTGHIGCLVHRYFNVTIKRPDDEDCEHWNNRPINYNDTITFWVKDLDYTGPIPYIEGVLDDAISEDNVESLKVPNHLTSSESGFEDIKTKKKKKKREKTTNSFISSTQLPVKCNESASDSGLDFDFLSPIQKDMKKKKKVEKEPTNGNVNQKIDQDDLFEKPLSKKKKKKSELQPEVESSSVKKELEMKNDNVEDLRQVLLNDKIKDVLLTSPSKILAKKLKRKKEHSPNESSKRRRLYSNESDNSNLETGLNPVGQGDGRSKKELKKKRFESESSYVNSDEIDSMKIDEPEVKKSEIKKATNQTYDHVMEIIDIVCASSAEPELTPKKKKLKKKTEELESNLPVVKITPKTSSDHLTEVIQLVSSATVEKSEDTPKKKKAKKNILSSLDETGGSKHNLEKISSDHLAEIIQMVSSATVEESEDTPKKKRAKKAVVPLEKAEGSKNNLETIPSVIKVSKLKQSYDHFAEVSVSSKEPKITPKKKRLKKKPEEMESSLPAVKETPKTSSDHLAEIIKMVSSVTVEESEETPKKKKAKKAIVSFDKAEGSKNNFEKIPSVKEISELKQSFDHLAEVSVSSIEPKNKKKLKKKTEEMESSLPAVKETPKTSSDHMAEIIQMVSSATVEESEDTPKKKKAKKAIVPLEKAEGSKNNLEKIPSVKKSSKLKPSSDHETEIMQNPSKMEKQKESPKKKKVKRSILSPLPEVVEPKISSQLKLDHVEEVINNVCANSVQPEIDLKKKTLNKSKEIKNSAGSEAKGNPEKNKSSIAEENTCKQSGKNPNHYSEIIELVSTGDIEKSSDYISRPTTSGQENKNETTPVSKKQKGKQDSTKKIQFYLKKLQEVGGKNFELLQNMLKNQFGNADES